MCINIDSRPSVFFESRGKQVIIKNFAKNTEKLRPDKLIYSVSHKHQQKLNSSKAD